MDSINFTDELLTKAVRKAHDIWLEASDTDSEAEHEYPKGFYESIVSEAEKRKQFRTSVRRIAAAVITLLISGAVILSASPEVRAFVYGHFLEIYYTQSAPDSDMCAPELGFSYLPDGFRKVNRVKEDGRISVYCQNDETKESFLVGCMRETDSHHIELHTEIRNLYEPIMMGGQEIFFYQTDDTYDSSHLIWYDGDRQLYFTVDSSLDRSEMLKIAEGLYIEDDNDCE